MEKAKKSFLGPHSLADLIQPGRRGKTIESQKPRRNIMKNYAKIKRSNLDISDIVGAQPKKLKSKAINYSLISKDVNLSSQRKRRKQILENKAKNALANMYALRSDDIPGAQPKKLHGLLKDIKRQNPDQNCIKMSPQHSHRDCKFQAYTNLSRDTAPNREYGDSLSRLEREKSLQKINLKSNFFQKSNSIDNTRMHNSRNYSLSHLNMKPKTDIVIPDKSSDDPGINRSQAILNRNEKTRENKRYQNYRKKFPMHSLKSKQTDGVYDNKIRVPGTSFLLNRRQKSLARAVELDNKASMEKLPAVDSSRFDRSVSRLDKIVQNERPASINFPNYERFLRGQVNLKLNNKLL
ncbi:unnamed protein product [Moneuplotes crassus]|uniref:Uncharacterized protein n=1 Tax=Euplotes crassus TaxID=5936 RepID=A0AAD1XGW0_EUPCR|nr:unnamed protein product [Moneuplotes crassus]